MENRTNKLSALAMPKWGMAMEEGEVISWHVAEGEIVGRGDSLVDVETSKVVNTAESPIDGVLVRRVAQEGDIIDVGALLAIIATEEVSAAEIDQFISDFKVSDIGLDADMAALRSGADDSGTAIEFEDEPFDGMRKAIAEKLSDSKKTIPHYRVCRDIEVDSLLALREQNNSTRASSLSINDFIIKACAEALSQMPAVNIQCLDHSIRRFSNVDIAIAVALENGLITPVLRSVDKKDVFQISEEARALVKRAKAGELSLDEVQGGAFSISNLGMYGVDQFDAIINKPQAAILAVGAAKPKAVVRDGSIIVATVMRVSLSVDHRVIDGAVAAQFLEKLSSFLENPKQAFS